MVCETGMPNDNIIALNNPNIFKVENKQGPNI